MLTLQQTGLLLSLITFSSTLLFCSTPSQQSPTDQESKMNKETEILHRHGLYSLEKRETPSVVTFLAHLLQNAPEGDTVAWVSVTSSKLSPGTLSGHYYHRNKQTLPTSGVVPGTDHEEITDPKILSQYFFDYTKVDQERNKAL